MSYIVEVRYTGADWPDLLADMRSWLDRRQIEPEGFGHSVLDRGVAAHVVFGDEDHAAAFATAFSGRLERTGFNRTARPVWDTVARAADEDASISEDLTILGEPPTESAQPAAKAGVSLMITRRQKDELREQGYSDEQIRDMKPEDAHRVLGLFDGHHPKRRASRLPAD